MESPQIIDSNQANIEIPLTLKNINVLSGLVKWSKIVGMFHIVLGIIYCLSIFLFMIPTVVIGVFFIILGTRLTNASANLRYSIQDPNEETIILALENLKKYLFFNGIMYIVMFLFVLIILTVILVFGVALFDILREATNPYVSIMTWVS